MAKRLRAVVADDHPIFRQGIRQVIGNDPRFDVVAEVADGPAALEAAARTKADFIILDINLPFINGLEVAQRLHNAGCATKVIILTMHKEEEIFNRAMNCDVRGYVLKDTAASDLVNCMKAVAEGNYYITPSMSNALLHRNKKTEALGHANAGLERLTTAEKKILKRVAANQTSKEIAKDLGVSYRTVEAHRANICSKLGVRGAHRLLQFALHNQSALG